MKKTPKWFYIVLLLIPFGFTVLLETGLRIFSYGKNLDQWTEISEGKLILNPDIGARYFTSTKNYPHSNHDSFDKTKKANTFRIFVLGGSSAAGFPFSPGGAFSRYIKDYMEIKYPAKTFEVINLGITAINTYTINDLAPGIIKQHPDLIIIYAGHNEYYGALGVGSLESIGNSPLLINTYLYLNRFKTFQLVKNFLKYTAGLLNSGESSAAGATLMARMAEEKSIPLNSEIYLKGAEQFRNNLDNIFSEFNENGIPVVIGTLTSNLKDLPPFISVSTKGYPEAKIVFNRANDELRDNNIHAADSLFRLAKDLDALKFRAPEIFNDIIKELSYKYNYTLANIDSIFNAYSDNNIVGNNLMIDHLHPTLEGYQLMGRIFSELISGFDLLNQNQTATLTSEEIDGIVKSNFAFSKLDSTVSYYTILNLLNDWPFVDKKNTGLFEGITFKNKIDSLAYKIVKENYNWETAHHEAYKWYLSKGDINNFSMELKVLYKQYPFRYDYLDYAAAELLKLKAYGKAEYFLYEKYKIEPDEFSAKWLGNINLFNNNFSEAVNYLNASLKLNGNDAQTLFNLSVAYSRMGSYDSALTTIIKCLKLNPNYANAKTMKIQLEGLLKKPR